MSGDKSCRDIQGSSGHELDGSNFKGLAHVKRPRSEEKTLFDGLESRRLRATHLYIRRLEPPLLAHRYMCNCACKFLTYTPDESNNPPLLSMPLLYEPHSLGELCIGFHRSVPSIGVVSLVAKSSSVAHCHLTRNLFTLVMKYNAHQKLGDVDAALTVENESSAH